MSVYRLFLVAAISAAVAASSIAQAASIISVSSGSQDGGPDIPLIAEPVCCASGFALHDHVYLAPHVPDPTRGRVIFEFDVPVIVRGLTMMQHASGITKLERSVGDSLASLVSAGTALSSHGDVTGSAVLADGSPDVFSWDTSDGGTFHKFVIAKTSLADGYASYRWYLEVSPVPEATTQAMLLAGLGLLALRLRRRRV